MEENFKIFFVNSEEGENQETVTQAFQLLRDADQSFNPQWITQQECLAVEAPTKPNYKLFIFNKFEGAGFEHIKGLGYRIYGPRCILSNLQNGLVLPKDKKRPIYNLAMKGVKICCTSIDKTTRENMLKVVHLMAGEMAGDLTEDVTHLVAGEVGSNKYMVALANKKIIMAKDWVTDVWQSSQNKHIMATDDVFKKHNCPCFLGLTVVVSGFNSNERNQIKNFVVKGGGKYSGELKMNECTHLIVREAKGAKYEAAKNWKIKIVRDKWLYDCIDKGMYLDTKPYEFSKNGKTAKTSTPERLSVAGPNIMDVSNISCAGPDSTMRVANESEMPADQFSFAGRTIAESRLGVTGVDMDVTVQPADIFLDGCKIYLSGVQSSIQEKLKKIITSGGGFRSMEITEEVTHIIMDDIMSTDLSLISKLNESPYVISSNWLMDCFAQNTRVAEAGYLSTSMDTKQNNKKKTSRVPPKFSDDPTTVSSKNEFVQPQDDSDAKKAGNSHQNMDDVDMESDLMMANILSQYTLDDNNELIGKNVDAEVEITKVYKPTETESNLELTQDPNAWDETCDASSGIFHRKTFMFFGIDREMEESKELEECIRSQGGRVVSQGKKRQIADIAIVPLTGFLVDATVSEVLTVLWLQMCLEKESLLPYDHWLARPMELPEEDILNGLCICVSGYVGVERDTIAHLAQSMGALCQDNFARCSNKSRNLEASTHLIVNAPGGSKYTAAKKWKIPAVGKEWLEACMKNKRKVSEKEFDVDILEEKLQEKEIEGSKPTAEDDKRPCENQNHQDETSIDRIQEKQKSSVKETKKMSVEDDDNGSFDDKGEKTRSESASSANECVSRVSEKTPSPIVGGARTKENDVTVPHLLSEDPDNNTADGNQKDNGRKAACHPNQSDNIKAAKSTPISTPLDRKKKRLAMEGLLSSPSSTSTPQGLIKGGGETPGTFQNPDFRPKFSTAQFFDPDTPQTTRDLNTSTPLGEVFSRQIRKAAQNAANLYPDEVTSSSQSQPFELPPLQGVIIAVAKKLGRNHATYNSQVVELGGGYSWLYDDTVTHFLFQGRVNDTNKEFRTARNDGKIIVSPHWLTMCKEQGCRVDESLFPHHYNPLAMVSSKETPSKSIRATRQRVLPGDNTPSRAANGKTPSRKMPVLNLQETVTKMPQTPTSGWKGSSSVRKDSDKASGGDDRNASPEESTDRVTNEKQSSKATDLPSHLEAIDDGNNEEKISTGQEEEKKLLDSKSLEMKDALAVLEEASRSKQTKKKKGRLGKLSGQLNSSGGKTPENSSRSGTPTWSVKGSAETEKNINQFPEPSQSLQVTWDDPTERLEKEKLAHRLERVCDPSQNTDDYMAALDLPSTVDKVKATASFNERSPTPEPPSIAFPVPRPVSDVLSPQPVMLLSDESCDGRMADNVVKETPIFLFSGMDSQERVEYGAIVEQLGGKVLEKMHFDPACTHLVVSQPVRNEKYLSSIAAGKWVLHKSYLEACKRERKLVKEDAHEWGSEYTLSIMQNMTAQAFKLALAAHKWRKKVTVLKKTNPMCKGAFDEWNVMLCLGRHKADNFKRILQAGGADVVIMSPPFPDTLQASHAFLDLGKVNIPQDDLCHFIRLGMHCLTVEYIAAYLTDDPLPDPRDFYNPEIVALQASMPELSSSRKRRAMSDEDNCGSRKMSRT